MKIVINLILLLTLFFDTSCQQTSNLINPSGGTIEERIQLPEGYNRLPQAEGTFGDYLRHLPLKPHGTNVHYYDGSEKNKRVHAAVVDMELSKRDLQQCADAVMRLRGEYLYHKGEYDQISFKLTNGFEVPFKEWLNGKRVKVTGNQTTWYDTNVRDDSYQAFRKYMDFVFTYAGTISLSASLHSKNIEGLEIGDVFIKPGSPGHAVIVVDVAINPAEKKLFLLAQSYMPAQDIHILNNHEESSISPWYSLQGTRDIITPEWTFDRSQLKTW